MKLPDVEGDGWEYAQTIIGTEDSPWRSITVENRGEWRLYKRTPPKPMPEIKPGYIVLYGKYCWCVTNVTRVLNGVKRYDLWRGEGLTGICYGSQIEGILDHSGTNIWSIDPLRHLPA